MKSASLIPEESDETGMYDSDVAVEQAKAAGLPFSKAPKFLNNPLPSPFKISPKELNDSSADINP